MALSYKTSGIYRIRNLKNGKCYVGSASYLVQRKYRHFSSLEKNCHDNEHLQSAYNKYGKENFVFEILIYCDKESLLTLEALFIKGYCSYKREYGYNKREIPNSNIGMKMSKESSKKKSLSLKGRIITEEHRKKLSASNRGKKRSEEANRKNAEAKMGVFSGSKNPSAKINESLAYEIKKMLFDDFKCTEISVFLGIRVNIIYSIKYGKTWRNVTYASSE